VTRPHAHPEGGPDDGSAFDWFRVLDVLVWVAVVVIVILGTEWFVGRLVREKIAGQAQRFLAKQPAAPEA
jgi:hypothetical protein